MLDVTLLANPTLAYFVVGLSIPVLVTALVGVALAGAVALTAGSGLLQSGRGVATAIAVAVVMVVVAALDLVVGALRARGPRRRIGTLQELGQRTLDVPGLGPKAVHLGSLSAADFPVPDGWVLPVVDDQWRKAPLRQIYRTLAASGHGRFIVRSCFAEEDGHAQSFAGLYESHPWNLADGRPALASAIDAVVRSRASARAVAYRGGAAPEGPTAVLIQQRIESLRCGFAASADVTTGFRERRLVDITTPDAPWNGYLDIVTGAVVGDAPAPDLVRDVARLTRRVERHQGEPVEIEWALDDEALWLIQARPITALKPVHTWIQGRGLELPWHPLTPLARSFLLGDGSPSDMLAVPLNAVGIRPPAADAFMVRDGRIYVDAVAAHDLTEVVADPSPIGWLRLLRTAWQAWRLDTPDERFPPPPADPPERSPSQALEALEALRQETLTPLVHAQTHALLVAGLCTRSLGDDAPPPSPRTARGAAQDAVSQEVMGAIGAARRWLWWQGDHPAAILAPRGLDDPTRLAAGLDTSGHHTHPAERSATPWRVSLRDRALTLRELLSARIQAANVLARHLARQLDAHLTERVEGWTPGDIALVSLTELRALVAEPLASHDVIASLPDRRAAWQVHQSAEPPAVWRLDARGETIVPTTSEAHTGGLGLGSGQATGTLLFATSATTPSDARGHVLFVAAPEARLTSHCLEAEAVVLARSGPLSHLAMVIRERGIPCVLLPDLPASLEEGCQVTVDAEHGEVRRAD